MVPLLVLIPLLGMAAVLVTPKEREERIRQIAAGSMFATFLLSLFFLIAYRYTAGGIQFEVNLPWAPTLGIQYHAGIDGIGVVMVLLTGLVTFSGTLVSQSVKLRVKEYFAFFLFLCASIFGVFTSFDLFSLYFFYEMTLIPLFPLIGIWGSKNKEYATMKLTLMITGGAVMALVAILAIYQAAGLNTFDLVLLQNHFAANPLPKQLQLWCAPLLLFGFGVIASLWPTHSWSPIGYAAAPTAVSMIHAGVLKKLGPFLIIRIALAFLPEGAKFWLPVVAALCIVNILYAGYCAMVHRDLKFIIGFSSVSHMGYVLLGIACFNQLGLSGAILLMFSHGVMAALTFSLIGFIYEQTHNRMVDELGGGLAQKIPFIAACFVVAAMASAGLPGFSNFIAEVLIFFGAWKQYPVHTGLAVFGILVTSVYLLRLVRNVFYGKPKKDWAIKDAVTFRQRLPYLLLAGALLVFGIFPGLLVHKMDPDVKAIAAKGAVMEAHP